MDITVSQLHWQCNNVLPGFLSLHCCVFLFFVHKMCKLALRKRNLAVPDLFPESWSSQRFHVLNSMNFCHEWMGRGEGGGNVNWTNCPEFYYILSLLGMCIFTHHGFRLGCKVEFMWFYTFRMIFAYSRAWAAFHFGTLILEHIFLFSATISSFKNPHTKIDLLARGQNPLSYYTL
jgi:hypothetical protein